MIVYWSVNRSEVIGAAPNCFSTLRLQYTIAESREKRQNAVREMSQNGLGDPFSRHERRYQAADAAQSTSFDPPRPNMLRTEPTHIVVAGNLADWLSLSLNLSRFDERSKYNTTLTRN